MGASSLRTARSLLDSHSCPLLPQRRFVLQIQRQPDFGSRIVSGVTAFDGTMFTKDDGV